MQRVGGPKAQGSPAEFGVRGRQLSYEGVKSEEKCTRNKVKTKKGFVRGPAEPRRRRRGSCGVARGGSCRRSRRRQSRQLRAVVVTTVSTTIIDAASAIATSPPPPPSLPPPPPPAHHPTSTIDGRWSPSLAVADAISIFAIVTFSSTSTAAVVTTLLLQLCKVSIRAARSV